MAGASGAAGGGALLDVPSPKRSLVPIKALRNLVCAFLQPGGTDLRFVQVVLELPPGPLFNGRPLINDCIELTSPAQAARALLLKSA